MTALALSSSALAAPGKIDICHLPDDNPSNAQDITVDESSLDDHLAHGDLQGNCPPTPAEIDPPTVRVNDGLEPPVPAIAGVNGGPPRPLARMFSNVNNGYAFNFVANEIFLVSDDPADLDDFRSRWPAQVLSIVELKEQGPMPPAPTRVYQIAVDASDAKTKRLDGDLALISPLLHGNHEVSSEASLQLLTLVASEVRRHGLQVGINALLESADFAGKVSEEAMIGDDQFSGPLSFPYTNNAFEWPYMNRNPDVPGDSDWPLDTGVAEAFRSMEAEGLMGNRIRSVILDGGFFPNDDFPPFVHIGALRTPNPDSSGCGRGFPAPGDSVCGTHGTHVTLAGFGLPDNAFGTMGPGGPVSELVTVQSPTEDVFAVLEYIVGAIPDVVSEHPDIINVSASAGIPGGWCPLVCPPLNLLGDFLFDRGILFVAAAGNAGIDVDDKDKVCVFGCIEFEAAQHIPCEVSNVVCVGAHTFFESRRTNYSNFGTGGGPNSVDIFAPGNLYSVDAVQADPTTARRDDLQLITGTSFASPFVAGTLALTWAGNPALTASQVRDCVMDSAHTESFTGEARRINTLGAVACAVGGTWPWVEITLPAAGTSYVRGFDNVSLLAESDDYEQGNSIPIQWTSSLDGSLGSSVHGSALTIAQATGMSIGEHEICANVLDNSGRDWDDCTNIEVTSAPPNIDILAPFNGQRFIHLATVPLEAKVTDPDGSGISDIRWEVVNVYTGLMMEVATGSLDTSFPAHLVPPGSYWVWIYVTDDTGAEASTRVSIEIDPIPQNQDPEITIDAPTGGQVFVSSDGGPVTIELQASASDAEDGPLNFADIEWFVRAEGESYFDPLTVTRECLVYRPDNPSICAFFGPWTFELGPQGSNTETKYFIRGRVDDSSGNTGRAEVTVFIQQVII